MNEFQFVVDIVTSKQRVWNTLWQDKTFRDWAGIIDPGTYMVGELKQGGTVQFISAENGYGVTSLVEELVNDEFLQLRHSADTQESGKKERANEWTGGKETYSLVENNGITTLTVKFDVPLEQEEYFNNTYPKALKRVKFLAES